MAEPCAEACWECNGAGGYEDYDGEWVVCSTCDGNGICILEKDHD